MSSFTHRERILIFWVSLGAIILTAAPYVAGWFWAGEDTYTWTHSLTVGDFFVYYSYINQIARGDFFPADLLTAETTRGILQIVWIVPAALVRVVGVSAGVAFHLYRLALIPIFVALVVHLCKRVLPETHRLFQVLFILTSSGIGFFAPLFIRPEELVPGKFSWPMDLWVPESNTFLTLLHSPHILLSLLLLVATFVCVLEYVSNAKRRALVTLAVSVGVLMLIHPFYLVTIGIISGGYALLLTMRRETAALRAWRAIAVITLAAIPGVSYYGWLLVNDAAFLLKARQNILLTTSLPMTLMSYGGLFVFAVVGLWRQRTSRDHVFAFVAVWALLGFALLYVPVSFQRRLSEGLHLPLALLSLGVLLPLFDRMTRMSRAVLMGFVLVVFSLSNIVTMRHDFFLLHERQYALVIPRRETLAAEWIEPYSAEPIVILAPLNVAPWLPSVTGDSVVVGHEIETLRVDEKIVWVQEWFGSHGRNELTRARESADLLWVQDDPALEQLLVSQGMPMVYDADGISLFETRRKAENR